jgi:hypothetical protein
MLLGLRLKPAMRRWIKGTMPELYPSAEMEKEPDSKSSEALCKSARAWIFKIGL